MLREIASWAVMGFIPIVTIAVITSAWGMRAAIIFGAACYSAFFVSFIEQTFTRLRRHQSLWSASHCEGCGRMLGVFEQIPVLSWMFLRGKCKTCNAPIAFRHIFLELSVPVSVAVLLTVFW